jgi:hypothetical protein
MQKKSRGYLSRGEGATETIPYIDGSLPRPTIEMGCSPLRGCLLMYSATQIL